MRFIFIFCLPLFIWAQNATLQKIIDADTLIFKYKNKQIICQLAFIDAPESVPNDRVKAQAKKCGLGVDDITNAGKIATEYTIKAIPPGKEYKINLITPIKDKWARCIIHIPQGTHPQLNPTLNGVLLDQGYGVFHKADAFEKEAKQMIERANLSQKENRGLWKKTPQIMECLKKFNQ
jgi:endonuclease YncB( thermonuclease family)